VQSGRSDTDSPFAKLLDSAARPNEPPPAGDRRDDAAPGPTSRAEATAPAQSSVPQDGTSTGRDGIAVSSDAEQTADSTELGASAGDAVLTSTATLADAEGVFGDLARARATGQPEKADAAPREAKAPAEVAGHVPSQTPDQLQADAQLRIPVPAPVPVQLPTQAHAQPQAEPETPAPVQAAAAAPAEPVAPAITPAAVAVPSETPSAPAAKAPAMLPLPLKVADTKGAEKPTTTPPSAPHAEASAEAETTAAPIGAPASAAGGAEIAAPGGEEPGIDRPAAPPTRQARAELPAGAGTDADEDPIARPQKPAEPAPAQANVDPATKPQPDSETAAKPRPGAETSPRQHPAPDAGTAAKAADPAVQNLGLSAPGAHLPSLSAAANAAQPAHALTLTAQAPAPIPLAGLAVEIAAAAHAGKQRFEIRLDPPELGRIDVRLDVDRDGNVTSRMTVERAETLDLLRRDAGQLERALQQAGLKTSDHSLEFSLRQQDTARDETAAQDSARLVASEDDPAPLEAARQGYGRLLGLGGGIDIRV
jgi:flagellar hook-length control protein FliK